MQPLSSTGRSDPVELLGRIAMLSNQGTALETGLHAALAEICSYTGWPVGHVFIVGRDGLAGTGIWHLTVDDRLDAFRRVSETGAFWVGKGLVGRVVETA